MENVVGREDGGYTLVEIMVAVLIIFIVMGGVYKTFVNENIDFERELIVLDMQNNARIALARVSRAVQASNFLGCTGELMVNNLKNAETTPHTPAKPTLLSLKTSAVNDTADNDDYWDSTKNTIMDELKGMASDVNWLGEPLGFYNDAAAGHEFYQEGTDAITLGFLTDEVALKTAMTGTNADIVLETGAFEAGDILFVTDCEHYSMFQKTNGDDTVTLKHAETGLNSSDDLGKEYNRTALARVFKLDFETFFVKDNTLYHNMIDFPIADNIEDLQFEFLFDLNENDDLTDDAWQDHIVAQAGGVAAVTFNSGLPVSAADIRAIRVYVLARSERVAGSTAADFGVGATTYDYPNSPYYSAANPFGSANGVGGAPDDNRFRYLASTEIYIRNSGLIK